MRTQSPSRIYTVSAAKTISTGTHAMSGRGKKKSESLKYNYSVHSPIYNENIIKMLCFFSTACRGRVAKLWYISAPPPPHHQVWTAGEEGESGPKN